MNSMRQLMHVLLLGVFTLCHAEAGLADDDAVPANHGYLLIRVKLTSRERVNVLGLRNVETEFEAKLNRNSFKPAGVNAWMALVEVPPGRYFLSEYVPMFGVVGEQGQTLNRRHVRSEPASVNETFEIVAGAVNYIGDWTLRADSSRRMTLDPSVEFNKTTLELYVTEFPDVASTSPLYLSPMGEKAVSVQDLANKTVQ